MKITHREKGIKCIEIIRMEDTVLMDLPKETLSI